MATCTNCDARLDGRHCAQCGQDSIAPPQQALGLAGFFTANALGLESRALRSIVTLLVHPGRLTRAYVDGQRIRYSSPVQIYLWCTALFFVVQALFPLVRIDFDGGHIDSSLSAIAVGIELSSETMMRLEEQGISLPLFAERFDAAVTAYFPVLLFVLVSAAAGLMALQFRGETALKHGVFALHWTAFYFTLEILRQLLPHFGRWGSLLSGLATALVVAYLFVAMRVVYERGVMGTAVRTALTIAVFSLLLSGWLLSTAALAERIA